MRIVLDVEANSLTNPTKIWVIVCKDIDSGKVYIFRNLTDDLVEKEKFLLFVRSIRQYIGHNFLDYDYPVLHKLLGLEVSNIADVSIDTLIISRLVDYSRKQGHSIEAYGEEFGLPKIKFNDWTKWSQEMEDYCVRDVEICSRILNHFQPVLSDTRFKEAIHLEHLFQLVVNELHNNGFSFNNSRARTLLHRVEQELAELDKEILEAFPPKLKLIREIEPRLTKHGTLNRTDFRFVKSGDLSEYNGGSFCYCSWVHFNPSSHKQIIEVLNGSGWKPVDKTAAHIEAERNRLTDRVKEFRITGWKVNENNLSTLPDKAPKPARLLAKRILLESRRRTLTEWIGLCGEDGRIHGKFLGIGAWTHRMAHQQPNTANIPNEFDTNGKRKLLGKEMRALWQAPKGRLLVGVDAEGIQLRIFAHYIDDKEFTNALVNGKKSDKSDPHSLNQRILGSVCKTRQSAKRFVYALLLGGGIGKLAQILECSVDEARDALNNLMERYQGFTHLKKTEIPRDGRRGYFIGLDGRRVPIPGGTASERSHLCMSGYLQNGEAIIMKSATLKWHGKLKESYGSWLVNLVHDEWQIEVPNDMKIALEVAKMVSDSLYETGVELNLKCPMAGSFYNEDHKDYTIGTNWSVTH